MRYETKVMNLKDNDFRLRKSEKKTFSYFSSLKKHWPEAINKEIGSIRYCTLCVFICVKIAGKFHGDVRFPLKHSKFSPIFFCFNHAGFQENISPLSKNCPM